MVTRHRAIHPRRPRAHQVLIGGKPTAHLRAAGSLHRGAVISAGNPATIQLEGSTTMVSLSLAQHVAQQTTPIAAGNTVIAVIFNAQSVTDGVIIAAY